MYMINYICIHLDIDKCKFQLSILCTCIYIYMNMCIQYICIFFLLGPERMSPNLCLHCTQCRHRSKEQSPNTLTRYPMQGSRTIAVSKLLGSTSRAMIASTSKLGRYPMHARMPSNSNCHVHWLGISCRDSKVE